MSRERGLNFGGMHNIMWDFLLDIQKTWFLYLNIPKGTFVRDLAMARQRICGAKQTVSYYPYVMAFGSGHPDTAAV